MLVGANALQRAAQVPSALIIALNGLIVVFVVSTQWYARRMSQNTTTAPAETIDAEPQAQDHR